MCAIKLLVFFIGAGAAIWITKILFDRYDEERAQATREYDREERAKYEE